MKAILIALCCAVITVHVSAQRKRMMMFEDYTKGIVLMTTGARTPAELNYDAANRNMMYKNGKDEMILTNNHQIDTVYIGHYKFIPSGKSFLEIIKLPNGMIGIDWLLKNVSQGYQGPYGTTQTKVETLNTAAWNLHTATSLNYSIFENQHTEIFKLANDNEYVIFRDRQTLNFKNKKNLLALFPGKEAEIESFMKEHKTDMKKTGDVLELVNYCLGL